MLVAFDLDGVVLDVLPVLRQCYFDFLARFGRAGTAAEFDRLNGPSLTARRIFLRRLRPQALAGNGIFVSQ